MNKTDELIKTYILFLERVYGTSFLTFNITHIFSSIDNFETNRKLKIGQIKYHEFTTHSFIDYDELTIIQIAKKYKDESILETEIIKEFKSHDELIEFLKVAEEDDIIIDYDDYDNELRDYGV